MALDSINSGAYTNLQNVLEAARKRTASPEIKQPEVPENREPVRVPKSDGGTLFARLYGNKIETKSAEQPRLGARFDRYA